MSVAPSEALERSVLEGKDREQLLTIAAALGVKPATRAKKADIIDKILEQVGVPATRPRPRRGPGQEGGVTGQAGVLPGPRSSAELSARVDDGADAAAAGSRRADRHPRRARRDHRARR